MRTTWGRVATDCLITLIAGPFRLSDASVIRNLTAPRVFRAQAQSSRPSSTVAAWKAARAWLTWERRFCCVASGPDCVSNPPREAKKTWRLRFSVSLSATIEAICWSCWPSDVRGERRRRRRPLREGRGEGVEVVDAGCGDRARLAGEDGAGLEREERPEGVVASPRDRARPEADALLSPREEVRDGAGDVDREESLKPQEPPGVVDELPRRRRVGAGLEDRPGRQADEEDEQEDDRELEGRQGIDELLQRGSVLG